MRKLIAAQNINDPDADYPKGSMRNKTSLIPGTIFSDEFMGDLVQTFQKLIELNGLAENNLADNETNKHQLLSSIFEQGLPVWKPTTSNVLFDNVKFVQYGSGLYFHKTTTNTDDAPNADTANWLKVLECSSVSSSVKFSNNYHSGYLNFDFSGGGSAVNSQVNQVGNVVRGIMEVTLIEVPFAAALPAGISKPSQNVYIYGTSQATGSNLTLTIEPNGNITKDPQAVGVYYVSFCYLAETI